MASSNRVMAGYEILYTLGIGARSTIFAVRKVNDRKSHLFALKVVKKKSSHDQRYVDQAISEYEITRKLDHFTLRKSYSYKHLRTGLLRNVGVVVVMEYVDGSPLNDEQQNIWTLPHWVGIFQDAAIGLGVMHLKGYVHADVKPQNILITRKDVVKIIDFGQSCRITGEPKTRIQGTLDYMAPEQIKVRPLSVQTDIFGLGATMYWVLTGKNVPTEIPKSLRRRLGAGSRRSRGRLSNFPSPHDIKPFIPKTLSNLVMSCVERVERERPRSMSEVYERLNLALNQMTQERKYSRRRFQPGHINPSDSSLGDSSVMPGRGTIVDVTGSQAGKTTGAFDTLANPLQEPPQDEQQDADHQSGQ